jgi:hypothetical protein
MGVKWDNISYPHTSRKPTIQSGGKHFTILSESVGVPMKGVRLIKICLNET